MFSPDRTDPLAAQRRRRTREVRDMRGAVGISRLHYIPISGLTPLLARSSACDPLARDPPMRACRKPDFPGTAGHCIDDCWIDKQRRISMQLPFCVWGRDWLGNGSPEDGFANTEGDVVCGRHPVAYLEGSQARDQEAGRGPEDRSAGSAGPRAAVDGRDRGGAASTWGDTRAIECGEYGTYHGQGPGGGASRGRARAGRTIEAGGGGFCRRTGTEALHVQHAQLMQALKERQSGA
jgi:hypothetical protein